MYTHVHTHHVHTHTHTYTHRHTHNEHNTGVSIHWATIVVYCSVFNIAFIDLKLDQEHVICTLGYTMPFNNRTKGKQLSPVIQSCEWRHPTLVSRSQISFSLIWLRGTNTM